jgi:hypothetical protein
MMSKFLKPRVATTATYNEEQDLQTIRENTTAEERNLLARLVKKPGIKALALAAAKKYV